VRTYSEYVLKGEAVHEVYICSTLMINAYSRTSCNNV
jgi:hypothetical protein